MKNHSEIDGCLYEFGDFRLLPAERLFLHLENPIPLPPKVFDTLLVLVERGGHLVEKDELLDKIWADAFVEEATLARNISILRKVLDGNDVQKFIETVPKRGYRFTEPVRRRSVKEESPPVSAEEKSISENVRDISPPITRRPVLLLMLIFTVVGGIFASLSFWTAKPVKSVAVKSIAVLPLKSLSPEADDQYLGLGIADSIIARTSQIESLTVRPTSAVRKYVNSDVDSLEAAREQKVDFVLDGTVQRSGDRLRVSLNLLRVSDGSSLWADIFNLSFNDIFAVQDKVSLQIASRLRLKLNEAEAERLVRRNTSNPEAFNYYTKAMYHFYNIGPDLNTRPESDLAIDLFKKAIELDPNYALAHAQLGYTYTKIAVFQEENPAWIEHAKQELGIAERLNPQLAEVHAARFFIAFSQYESWDIETAFRELRLAQEIDPDVAHGELADLYNHVGMEDKSIEEFETALQIDPNNDSIKEAYIYLFYQVNRPDLALDLSNRLFNRGPTLQYYLEKMMGKEAETLIENELKKQFVSDTTRMQKIVLLSLQGKHNEEQAAALEFIQTVRKNRGYHHYAYYVARVYALGGKSEEAVKWLRVTATEGFPCYPLFERDPYLDPIRKDHEFAKFLAEMKERREYYIREFG